MTRHLLAASTLALALTACTAGPTDAFSDVLPDDRVLIALPTDDASAARVGEWSEAYLLTAEVTKNVNGLAGYVLILVDTITDYPASTVSDDGTSATWGPFADALDPVETQLWVVHNDDDSWSWGFDQRPKNDETAEWTSVVTGEVEAGATDEASRGSFDVDWTTMNGLNPNTNATGTFSVDYDIGATGVSGVASFADVTFDDGEPVNAMYAYEQVHEGDGAMDLSVDADFDDTATEATETLEIRSRWQSTGAGRSDVRVHGGDLGDAVGTASECWDTSFQAVYYVDDFTPTEEGSASDCAFDDAEFTEE